MSERIRALLLQAGFSNAYADPKDGFELVFVDENHTLESATKFAALIVKECSLICQNVGDTLWAEQYQSNIGTARTCEAAIREHFGVEE